MSKKILLLAALLLGANNIYAHNPGAVKKILPVFKLFGIDPFRTMTVQDSLAELGWAAAGRQAVRSAADRSAAVGRKLSPQFPAVL